MVRLMAVVPHEEYCDALYQLEEVEQLATIEKLADMLGLKTKQYNADQIRCSCPNHGGEHKLSRSFDPVAFAAKLVH